ncbi:MAG: hypothetical protein HY723_02420 [Chloroflexi bacterium]|nr:hypothetical protein [Chloroflexota bacterium]
MSSTAEFESAAREAERELSQAATADDVRRIWQKHYLILGHRALGRLLLGRGAAQLIERRAEGAARD